MMESLLSLTSLQIKRTVWLFTVLLLGVHATEEVIWLEPAVVKATKLEASPLEIPAAVSVVDQRMIQTGSAQLSINESLQTVPGVFVLNPFNYAQDSRIAIRGFGARSDFGIRGVRLIVDGIPATLPDGQAGVDGIDLGSAQSIELLRGSAASIYGPASGGVIRIESESAPEGVFVEPRITVGEYGLQKTQLKSGWGNGPWNLILSGSALDLDGYRENSRTSNSSLNAILRHQAENGARTTTVVNIIDYPVQDDPGGLTAEEVAENPRQARDRNLQFDGGEAVQQEKLGVTTSIPLAEGHEISVNGFAVQRDFSNKLPFQNGGQVAFDRDFFGGGVRHDWDGEAFRMVSGFELGQQQDDRQNYDNLNGTRGPLVLDQQEDVRNIGGYVSGERDLSEEITLSAAIRVDEVRFDVQDAFLQDGDDSGDLTFQEVSPTGGLRWQPRPELSVYGNVARSFETPTTTEFDNPNGGGFNESLEPQTALSVELGVKGDFLEHPWHPAFDVAVFTIDVEDALVPFELEEFPGREFYRNAGSAQKNGVEASLRLRPFDFMLMEVSYTYSDFTYDQFGSSDGDVSGNRLPGIPEHFGNIRIDLEGFRGSSFIWNTRFVGAMQANDANTTEIDGSTVSDLRVVWEWVHQDWNVEAYAGLNNVFDESYSANVRINAFGDRFFEPGPERNMYTGVRVRRSF